jgi:hypothetical protein
MMTFVSGERLPFSSSHFLIAQRSYTLPSPARTGSFIKSNVRGHSPQSFCRFFPGVRLRISDGFSSVFPWRIFTSSLKADCRIDASRVASAVFGVPPGDRKRSRCDKPRAGVVAILRPGLLPRSSPPPRIELDTLMPDERRIV